MKKQVIIVMFAVLMCNVSCAYIGIDDRSLQKGSSVKGTVVTVIDGDTYDVMLKRKREIRVRMEGIDAPEKGMPFYKESKDYLTQLCFDKKVIIEITGKDANDRILGFTYLNDETELSREMIKAGLAWHYKKYNTDTILSDLETEAKELKKGLWVNENPMSPWTNRSLHRQGISTRDSFDIAR